MSTFDKMMRIAQAHADHMAKTLKSAQVKRNVHTSEFETDLLNASMEAEMICNNLRKMLIMAGVTGSYDRDAQLRNIHNIEIDVNDETVHMTLPSLPLKKPDHKNCSFLIDPIIHFLQNYIANTRPEKRKKFNRARVTLCHCYPKDTPARRVRDCDNIEVKKLLDVLALYFLKDDNIACCEILHTSRPAEDYMTEITITDWGENQ